MQKKKAPSLCALINLAMIFYLSPWMSANERESLRGKGKGERVPEKRGSGLGGVIKARQVGQTYAWLPGKCVTCW